MPNVMIKASITYFDLKEFGFYRLRQGKNPEHIDGTIPDVVASLVMWLEGKMLVNTIPWDVDTNKRRTKMYCRSYKVDSITNDTVLVLWKAVGDSSGNVHGAYASSDVGSDAFNEVITSAGEPGKEVIWGQPCYYWIIPEENKVASIKFANSIADTDSLGHYIKAFVDFRGDFPNKKFSERMMTHPLSGREIKIKSFTFEYKDEKDKIFHAKFKMRTQLYKKASSSLNYVELAKDVTQIVYRDTISAKIDDSRPSWAKICDVIGPAMGIKAPPLKSERHIEVIVDASPNGEELTSLIEKYTEEHDEDSIWNNIGLKVGGRSETTIWLDEFVLRDELNITKVDSEVYTAEQILVAINAQRKRLINKITTKKSEVSVEEEIEAEEVVEYEKLQSEKA
ncbi:hypothetical protein [Oceanisphaera arctica]|uniref:Uncharacterized protein n=1 Tax=Oceanisphaera arctica TaxID=641510 RepID=A0A2P5TN33_9GAMM|nr:hypothetical protein [Oceanisphaera arctica]PPL16869.1 hypothetical protein UN63_07020 [Oceanisphaera arctica]GHA19614.1 hypothetical protein GCM10007082_20350 [Oceanisphaera arctica]